MNPSNGPVLRDIHPAASPSWWPPAPGWWLLAAVAIAMLAVALVYFYRKARQRRRRSELLVEFERAIARANDDGPALAATLSTFLRRAQLRATPRAAALPGAAWLAHLDQQSGSDEFSAGVGRALVDAPYRRQADFDAPALIALTRRSLLAAFDTEVSGRV